ncbi:MAG: DUF3267 domain-containing protein [Anaerolineae bacterium]|nr:DUF3267 domain-containing protein [Anaerolineae bacterium]
MAAFNLPAGYREALHWRISQKRGLVLLINLLAFPALFLFGHTFFFLVRLCSRPPAAEVVVTPIDLLQFALAVILLIPAHELMHGLALRLHGVRPRYGFLWQGLFFYTTAPGHAFRRNQYLVFALAPLASLSLLACCIILLAANAYPSVAVTAALFGAVNGGASIGDLWISAIVLRYPAHAYVIDERDGMRVFLPAEEHGPAAAME